MSVRTCDHLKEDGVFCNSPALRGRNYCFFHLNLRGRRLKMARARARGQGSSPQIPFPEDMHAVQVSLHEVLQSLADDRIDPKRAGLMLYALQQASTNLNCTAGWQGSREQVDREQPLRALEYPGFEEQYDLPQGIDLEASPEIALQQAEQNPDPPPTARKHRRLARVPMPRHEAETEQSLSEEMMQELKDKTAMEWFFDRLGLEPPPGAADYDENGPLPGKKPVQSVALTAPENGIGAPDAPLSAASSGEVA